jgi:hypothetical protein
MREYIRPSDIANEVLMKRSVFSGSFLIVEGVTDSRLYGKFVDRLFCMVVPAHSKDNVRMSVRELLRRNCDRSLGIVDSDMDRLRGIDHRPPIFVTDHRDIDTVMIWSGALDHVLTEFGDHDKMTSFVNRYGSIRDAVAASCYPLGLLMYVSDVNDHGLSFKDLDHTMFVDKKGLRPDVKAMIDTVIDNSPNSVTDARTLTTQLNREFTEEREPWDVCRGHDMLSVLSMGLRDVFGTYNCRYIRASELAGALRLAYDRETFRATRLFSDSETWCSGKGIRVWG